MIDVLIVTGALVAGWAVLRVVGGERERRAREIEHAIRYVEYSIQAAAKEAANNKIQPKSH